MNKIQGVRSVNYQQILRLGYFICIHETLGFGYRRTLLVISVGTPFARQAHRLKFLAVPTHAK
jgi:hypothetical protein